MLTTHIEEQTEYATALKAGVMMIVHAMSAPAIPTAKLAMARASLPARLAQLERPLTKVYVHVREIGRDMAAAYSQERVMCGAMGAMVQLIQSAYTAMILQCGTPYMLVSAKSICKTPLMHFIALSMEIAILPAKLAKPTISV